MPLVAPHGGSLVNRVVDASKAEALKKEAAALPAVTLSAREAGDLEMIAIGAFSPLTGFMGQKDFEGVCKNIRLASGVVWPTPVILSPADDVAAKINVGQRIALKDDKGRLLAVMNVTEKYAHDKKLEIPNVYKTEEDKHPGVAIVQKQ